MRGALTAYHAMFVVLRVAPALNFLILVAHYHAFDLPLAAMAGIPLLIGVFPATGCCTRILRARRWWA